MKNGTLMAEQREQVKHIRVENAIQDADFADICHLVAAICHSPVSLISIIGHEREWFRSHHPLITAELTAEFAFCKQALHNPSEIFIIHDLREHYKFSNSALVTGVPYVIFYAGIPLVTPEGNILGVLCMWDNKARDLDDKEIAALSALARQTAIQLELKNKVGHQAAKIEELKTQNTDLEGFTTIAAHDLKSPLNSIVSLTDLIKNNYATCLDDEGNEYINFLHSSAHNLTRLVTAVLNYSRSSHLLTEKKEDINFGDVVEEVTNLLHIPKNASVSYEKNNRTIHTSRIALKQILLNLLDNALKFNDKGFINIEVVFSESSNAYSIEVTDNGQGIPAAEKEKIFELFRQMQSKIKDGKGMGIGLAIVKKLVEKLDGSIKVESELSRGATFTITLPKQA
jgi:signal transduction histidine kinase